MTPPGGSPDFRDRLALAAALAVAVAARAAAVAVWSEDLSSDPDAYAGLAERLAAGAGFVAPGGGPTAYRPPLYPLLLAGVAFAGRAGVAALHVALGVGTVYLTWRLGRRFGLGSRSLVAAGLVALDPLLLRYTPQVMTEIAAAFVATLLLWTVCGIASGETASGDGRRPFLAGAVFGLACLTRPTFWVFGLFIAAFWCLDRWHIRHRPATSPLSPSPPPPFSPSLFALAGTALIVTPWAVRNAVELGRPVVTTTHGGYTLLLANNDTYYDEVIFGPDAAWRGESLDAWQRGLEAAMAADGVRPGDEIARDRWMGDRAAATIRDRPVDFMWSCLHRLGRFWAVSPAGASAAVGTATGVVYGTIYLLVALGLWRIAVASAVRRSAPPDGTGPHTGRRTTSFSKWRPVLLLIAAFAAVHALYWTDARMRAPVVPAIALLAARGCMKGAPGRHSGPRT